MKIWIYTVEEENYAAPIVRVHTSLEDMQRAFVADILEDERNPDDFEDEEEGGDMPNLDGLKALKNTPIAEQFAYAVDLYEEISSQGDNDYPYYHDFNEGPIEVTEPVTTN